MEKINKTIFIIEKNNYITPQSFNLYVAYLY